MLSAILEKLQTNVATLDPELVVLFGAEHLSDETGAHQVVVVPGKDRYDGPTLTPAQPSTVQKALRQRWVGVQFHIWGKPGVQASGIDNTDDVEAILQVLVQSLHDTVFSGGFRIADGGWEDPQGEGAELTDYGRYYVLAVEFSTPVVRQAPATAVIRTAPLTLELNPQMPA